MKFLSLAFVALFSVSAFALRPTPLALSSSTSAGPLGLMCGTLTGNIGDLGTVVCYGYAIAAQGLSTSTILLLKEEVKHVEPDVYSYLAGEEISLALEEAIERVRTENEELAEKSDQEIAVLLLQLAELE